MKKTKTEPVPRDFTGILGLIQIFVLVSISYSTYVVALGTQGYASRVMLIPQALFAAVLLVKKFTR